MIHSKFFLFTLLCGLAVGSALASSIETPEKKISLRFSTLFNFINFSAKDSYFKNCNLNQPIDIGIGGGFGDFFWDFTYALPFSIDDKSSPSEVFELKTNFYPRDLWLHGMVGFYNRFVFPKEEEYVETKLQIFEARISGLYFLENERFSWRAAYELDRIQKKYESAYIRFKEILDIFQNAEPGSIPSAYKKLASMGMNRIPEKYLPQQEATPINN